MRTTLHAIGALILSSSLNAQWTAEADIPAPPFDYGYSFTVNGKIYVGAEDQSLSMFDPVAGTWTDKAPYPGLGTANSTAFVVGSTAYVGLGFVSGSTFSTDLWAYNPATNAWTAKAAFPGTARGGASAFVVNGKGYVCGGTSASGQFSQVYAYDPVPNTWTQVSTLPTGNRGFTAAFVLGNYGYVYGGYVGFGNETNQLHRYDPVANTWSQMANFPAGGRQSAVAFVIGNKAFVGMGHAGFTSGFSNFYSYDPVTNTWAAAGSFPGGNRIQPVAAAIGGTAYLGSGASLSTFQGTNDWWSNDGLVGIDELDAEAIGMRVLPSVTSGPVQLTFGRTLSGTITVVDMVGRSVFATPMNGDREVLDLSTLGTGVYLVRFQADGIDAVQRVVRE